MKLLQKATRYYFVFLLAVLSLSTVIFYFLIQYFILQSIDKTLLSEKEKIGIVVKQPGGINNIKLDGDEEFEIKPINNITDTADQFSNVAYVELLSQNKEKELHRQLKTYVKVDNQWYEIKMLKSLIESDDLLWSVVIAQIITFVLILISFLIINYRISKNLWSGFYATLEKIKYYNFNIGAQMQLSATDIQEFDELNSVLNAMAQRIYTDYINQRQFVENTSHELQTPLAIINAKIEMLIQNANLSDEEAKMIQSIYDASLKLSRLNRALMLLAKIENNQFAEVTEVNIRELVNKILLNFEDKLQMKNIALTVDDSGRLNVKMNAILADILFTNLFQNAIRHNNEGGVINIEIASSSFVISNSGAPLPFDDKKLFDRFRKRDDSKESTGLGLSIVKQICNLYKAELNYSYSNDLHKFSIKFNV